MATTDELIERLDDHEDRLKSLETTRTDTLKALSDLDGKHEQRLWEVRQGLEYGRIPDVGPNISVFASPIVLSTEEELPEASVSAGNELQGIADDLTLSGKQPVAGTLTRTQFAKAIRDLNN